MGETGAGRGVAQDQQRGVGLRSRRGTLLHPPTAPQGTHRLGEEPGPPAGSSHPTPMRVPERWHEGLGLTLPPAHGGGVSLAFCPRPQSLSLISELLRASLHPTCPSESSARTDHSWVYGFLPREGRGGGGHAEGFLQGKGCPLGSRHGRTTSLGAWEGFVSILFLSADPPRPYCLPSCSSLPTLRPQGGCG